MSFRRDHGGGELDLLGAGLFTEHPSAAGTGPIRDVPCLGACGLLGRSLLRGVNVSEYGDVPDLGVAADTAGARLGTQ